MKVVHLYRPWIVNDNRTTRRVEFSLFRFAGRNVSWRASVSQLYQDVGRSV